MALVAPDGPVYQAGTLSGHPLAMAAGIATLDALEADAYAALEATGAAARRGLGRGDRCGRTDRRDRPGRVAADASSSPIARRSTPPRR